MRDIAVNFRMEGNPYAISRIWLHANTVQTTERYLGCKHRIRSAVNDHDYNNDRRFVVVLHLIST
jgi:hypothetical protein